MARVRRAVSPRSRPEETFGELRTRGLKEAGRQREKLCGCFFFLETREGVFGKSNPFSFIGDGGSTLHRPIKTLRSALHPVNSARPITRLLCIDEALIAPQHHLPRRASRIACTREHGSKIKGVSVPPARNRREGFSVWAAVSSLSGMAARGRPCVKNRSGSRIGRINCR